MPRQHYLSVFARILPRLQIAAMLLESLYGPVFGVFLVGASLPFAHARVRAIIVVFVSDADAAAHSSLHVDIMQIHAAFPVGRATARNYI